MLKIKKGLKKRERELWGQKRGQKTNKKIKKHTKKQVVRQNQLSVAG